MEKINGINGRLFTSKKDHSKSIFIPAAGYALNGSVGDRGRYCNIWSSMLSADYVDNGQYLYFLSGNVYLGDSCRYFGRSVRGVIG